MSRIKEAAWNIYHKLKVAAESGEHLYPDFHDGFEMGIEYERKRAQVLIDAIQKEIERCGTWRPGEEALKRYEEGE